MSDQSLFNEPNPQTPANNTPTNSNPDPIANLLGQIKNDKGEPKYRTIEDALNALKHSQEYIPQLSQQVAAKEAELEAARVAANKVAELERVVLELTQKPASSPTPVQGMTPEQIAELVNRQLTQKQQEDIQKNNLQTVVDAVKSKFGDKSEEVFYAKAKELGMDMKEFNTLAARSPKIVFAALGIQEPVSKQPGTAPAPMNTSGFQPQATSFLGRNKKSILNGGSTFDVRQESADALQMAQELHSQGKSIHDLTDPKVYFKYFQ